MSTAVSAAVGCEKQTSAKADSRQAGPAPHPAGGAPPPEPRHVIGLRISGAGADSVWIVYVGYGRVNFDSKADTGYVWPVRGGN